jgi:hypothetical protein
MKLLRCSFPLVCALLLAAPALAQERDTTIPRVSPNASAGFQLGVTQIDVSYGAPSVRDRVIFGELVPFGEVWRTGANEATTITFSTDVFLAGRELAAGRYMVGPLPGPAGWTAGGVCTSFPAVECCEGDLSRHCGSTRISAASSLPPRA